MVLSIMLRICLIELLAVGAAGCGQQKSKVAGAVTYNDKPLVSGTVLLMSSAGQPFQGEIQQDGRFVVTAVPIGNYQVAVVSEDLHQRDIRRRARKGESPEASASPKNETTGWFAIPEKYSKLEESGLSVTVDKGNVLLDIRLTD